MASNQLGSCTVTPGSYLVTFNSIVNINNIVAGDLFRILDDNVFYTIASVNATNLTCTLSSKYFNSLYSLQIFNEVVATSDGTRKFYKSVDNTLVIPGSCSFRDGNSVETFSDNGDGTLTGSLGGTGTVWYDDGSVNLTFVNYVPPAVAIYGSYQYGFPLSQVPFQIIRDYTPHFSWPEPYATDQSHQTITRQALRLIDNDLYNHGARTFEIQVFDSKTNVYVGDGSRAITVPYISSGYLLTDAIAGVHTKGVTGTTDVQIRKRRDGSNFDMLARKITIGNEYYARDGSANNNYRGILTGDQIYIDVDTKHTTAPKGLFLTLTFQKA